MPTTTETAPLTSTGSGGTTLRPRHIVEMVGGKPADKCLCGYLWDVFPIPFDEAAGLCQECVAEFERREGHGKIP